VQSVAESAFRNREPGCDAFQRLPAAAAVI
jgi:hypothetical protein